MLEINIQLFGGRSSSSGMSESTSGGGGIVSKNGVSSGDAVDDYWSKGWSGKKDLAQDLAKGREQVANEYAERERRHDERLAEDYDNWDTRQFMYESDRQNQTLKNTYKAGKDRLSSGYDYKNAGRQYYDNELYMATADVAKRMGYNVSGYMGVGSVSLNNLQKAMGAKNANALIKQVESSAQSAINSHKRKRK